MTTEVQRSRLTPPKIRADTIAQKIVCTRPMREGKFNISVEKLEGDRGSKTVVHCYGHGGSGLATLFGSVNKAIALFEKRDPDKSRPIRVLGSGCMGLTCAIELARRGYKVAGISTKSVYDTPSWRAGGYFALVSVKTSPDEQADLNEIGMHTFSAYKEIETGKHPYVASNAVRYMPVYCSRETESGVEHLEQHGLIPPREEVTLDFGNRVVHTDYLKFMTYFMNTTYLMNHLLAEVERRKIPIELREVCSFDELDEEILFNCTGIGSSPLNRDSALIPVRGHIVTLTHGSGSGHMDYMIYTKVLQEAKEEYIYMFPKDLSVTPDQSQGLSCKGVLGGTFIENVERLPFEAQADLDQIEFKRLLDRLSLFFHGKLFR